jgi:sugar diacid utilization regulator
VVQGAVLPALRTAVATSTSSRTVAAAMTNSLAVLITAGDGDTRTPIPPGIAVCVGPEVAVERCVDSWSQAHRGIRFAAMRGALSRWITSDELGCTIALADLDSTSVAVLPDVRAIDRLAHGRTRATDLELLDSLGRLGSVRESAAALHMHHSSVAYRIGSISDALGFDIRSLDGRYRARTALLLWQLHVSPHAQQA